MMDTLLTWYISKIMWKSIYIHITHVDKAVVEMEAKQRSGHPGVLLDRPFDSTLHDFENGRARFVIESGREAAGRGQVEHATATHHENQHEKT